MQLNAERGRGLRTPDSAVLARSANLCNEATIDRAVLERLDVALFKALRKIDAPKQRVCSALWLSYAEYDELSKLL